jgi:hypothetical protein
MVARTILNFVLIFFVAASGVAEGVDGPESSYNHGNVRYRDGDFIGAISAYEEVISQNIENGDVYYNLGNAYFKKGDLGRAILSYERALRLMPGDDDILANLQFANGRRVDKESVDPANFLTRMLHFVFDLFDINSLSVFCLILAAASGSALVGWLFAPQRRFAWIFMLAVSISGLAGSGILLGLKVHARAVEAAIVLESEAVGRSGPGGDFLQVFVLHEGTKVFVERQERGWFLVKLANGVGGWVRDGAVEKI